MAAANPWAMMLWQMRNGGHKASGLTSGLLRGTGMSVTDALK